MRPTNGRSRRSSRRAFEAPPNRPKLLPYITTVSKWPSCGMACSTATTRASLTPRRRATSTASGELSMATTSWPRACSSSADPARAAAGIEHAPAHGAQRSALGRRPAANGGEVAVRPGGCLDEPVIALDDLLRSAALEVGEEQLPVRVGLVADGVVTRAHSASKRSQSSFARRWSCACAVGSAGRPLFSAKPVRITRGCRQFAAVAGLRRCSSPVRTTVSIGQS
jgi:hypothetical protein